MENSHDGTVSTELSRKYQWVTLDLNNILDVEKLHDFLLNNYIGNGSDIRFNYTVDFLNWILNHPDGKPDWNCGIVSDTKLVGFIAAIPIHIYVDEIKYKSVAINFLCVHSDFRGEKLSKLLIQEITERVKKCGITQAVYTSCNKQNAIAECRYWHYPLNPSKLLDIKFIHSDINTTLWKYLKMYKLPKKPTIIGLREIEPRDIPQVCKVINDYLSRFRISQAFTEEECSHWFLKKYIVYCYVIERGNKITDMLSFYYIPHVVNDTYHKILRNAYSFYNVANTIPYRTLILNSLILSKSAKFDVFNMLDLMDNSSIFQDLKFNYGYRSITVSRIRL